MADKLLAARGASQRTDSLRTCFNRAYDRQRAMCEDAILIKRWFKLVEEIKAEQGICDKDVYNFDEAGFIIGKITTQLVITGLERRGRRKMPLFLIFASQYHLSAWYKEAEIPRDWAIAVSDNGWTNDKLRVEWLKHFNAHTQARTIGARRLLIIDGHRSHQSLEFQELCKENNIYTLSFRGAGLIPLQLEAVLLKLDISSLEKANSAASARRQRSKRRIQKHGVLTKGAGEDILAQNEADQQIAHEERQGGARSGLSQRAQRRCTRCKETGHNSRTCNTNTLNIQ
ncbi:ZnF-C2HC domain containing protein [Pyrenophora tritici-repentis]|uniref:ZnF-C2HC domain containing protein n=1 Tax=Pyrenophora tritici-repentis TaxID=45151 RepID=A0A834RZR2_9PLEO|nr:ZnF-C2HC domain containing protein [Pyrenophora tritici-repentis]